jgi:hypothetical protein
MDKQDFTRLVDVLLMLVDKGIRDWSMIFHHMIGFTAAYLSSVSPRASSNAQMKFHETVLYVQTTGCFSFNLIIRLLSEISTPFINHRWFLLTLNMKYTKHYLYNGYLILLTFFFFRVVPIPPLFIHLCSVTFMPQVWQLHVIVMLNLIFSFSIDALNLFWFRKIALGAIKTRNESKQKVWVKQNN